MMNVVATKNNQTLAIIGVAVVSSSSSSSSFTPIKATLAFRVTEMISYLEPPLVVFYCLSS